MRALIPVLALLLSAGGFAAHAGRTGDAQALARAKAEAAQANQRYRGLQRQAQQATSAAARARAESEALAARIEAAEADLTAAERRISIVETMQAVQQARLAERQEPVVRLTAALQTMARRPAALALVQPGSVRNMVHVRSLLAATLPEIRRRTAVLRAEVARGTALRSREEEARRQLAASREALRGRRAELATFEAQERTRSSRLTGLALSESDRALAFGEEARALARTIGRSDYQAQLAADLARLPGPLPRPGPPVTGEAAARLPYLLPVTGRLITGVGEISDGGVHSRGLTFETAAEARIVSPAAGRVVHAAPFRSYNNVVIIDHGRGWSTVITDLASLNVAPGARVQRGTLLGRAGPNRPQVSVELRRGGRPVPVAQLISG